MPVFEGFSGSGGMFSIAPHPTSSGHSKCMFYQPAPIASLWSTL
jgi:hypothetical protein